MNYQTAHISADGFALRHASDDYYKEKMERSVLGAKRFVVSYVSDHKYENMVKDLCKSPQIVKIRNILNNSRASFGEAKASASPEAQAPAPAQAPAQAPARASPPAPAPPQLESLKPDEMDVDEEPNNSKKRRLIQFEPDPTDNPTAQTTEGEDKLRRGFKTLIGHEYPEKTLEQLKEILLVERLKYSGKEKTKFTNLISNITKRMRTDTSSPMKKKTK